MRHVFKLHIFHSYAVGICTRYVSDIQVVFFSNHELALLNKGAPILSVKASYGRWETLNTILCVIMYVYMLPQRLDKKKTSPNG